MRPFTAALLFLFLVTSPFVATGLADAPKRPPVEDLIDQAKAAFDRKEHQTFEALIDRIFERIVGVPSSISSMRHIPPGMSDDTFIERMCDFDRRTQRIYSQEFWDVIRYKTALMSYSVVREGAEQDIRIRAMTECTFGDGQPTKTSQFMLDGISWAKTFQRADAKQAFVMAKEIEKLAAQHPKINDLSTLSKLVRFHAQDKLDSEQPEQEKSTRNIGCFFSQPTLVDKADKGDLAAQLEVARRLETGNKFRQDSAMAFFWYTRALQNGGGKIAQAGMDRILPRLTDVDHIKIDVWTRLGHRPY